MRFLFLVLFLAGCLPQNIEVEKGKFLRITTQIGGGSGFQVIGPNGGLLILTNAHVCQDAKTVEVQDSGYGEMVELRVLWKAVDVDICAIEGFSDFGTLRLAKKEAKPRDRIEVVGYPGFFGQVRVNGYMGENNLVATSVYPGNSGSPVLNIFGEVVGMISQGYSLTNWGVMVPVQEILDVLGYPTDI